MASGLKALQFNVDNGDGLIHVEKLRDVVVEGFGHGIGSDFFEREWAPILGPTSVLLARRLAEQIGHSVEARALARGLGLAPKQGMNSPLMRSVRRLTRYGVARVDPQGVVLMRSHVDSAVPQKLVDAHGCGVVVPS